MINVSSKQKSKKIIKPPFGDPIHAEILFSIEKFESLLNKLEWDFSEWVDYWSYKNGEKLASSYWAKGTKLDWIWGLGLPFLTEISKCLDNPERRYVLGLSALPGCGKTTFGRWLEASAKELNMSVKVISLDDFYLTGSELDLAMQGNPWGVPRGFPGSHSIKLLDQSIDHWLKTGELNAPKFDKALRNGYGDRSGWHRAYPDLLVLEGWFLGCYPIDYSLSQSKMNQVLTPPLTEDELIYRKKIQKSLSMYLGIWKRISKLWHIKTIDFSSTCQWKVQQEQQMLLTRGSGLQGEVLTSFLRMIQASIPQFSLMEIDCDVVVEVNQLREIINIETKKL
ncbi:uridine kinase [Prochlorococcus marinus]|uniref:uridine kinase n=1 Tax=Prochlorococcus marinus TaxID=1219 RepID=UPI0022B5642C|nr:uridine kinase [Prochlorococcus marinus]